MRYAETCNLCVRDYSTVMRGILQVSRWVSFRMVELETGGYTHRRVALFAVKCCCFFPLPFLLLHTTQHR